MKAPGSLIAYLRNHGPTRSTELVSYLQKQHGQSKDAAKKAVSRLGAPARRLPNLKFEGGELFYHLEDQLGLDLFVSRLGAALIESNALGGCALLGLEAQGGIIREKSFSIISGAPYLNRSGHMSASTLLEILAHYKLVVRTKSPDGEPIVTMPYKQWSRSFKAKWTVDAIAQSFLRTWVRNMALGSANKIEIDTESDKLPQFAGYGWNLSSPSYLSPLTKWNALRKKIFPGCFVADYFGSNLSMNDVRPILKKFDALKGQKKGVAPFLAMVVAEGFHPEALDELRNRGIVTAQSATLWGKEAAAQLSSLLAMLENAAAATAKDPGGVIDIFDRIGKTHGKLQQMRGPLMEHIVGYLFLKEGYRIDMGEVARTPAGEETDIDVKAIGRGEIICAECKGYGPGASLSLDEVIDWLDRRVPRAKQWLETGRQSKHVSSPCRFQLYFSGAFSDEVTQHLTQQRDIRSASTTLEWFDGKTIADRLKKMGESSTLKTFNEYFS